MITNSWFSSLPNKPTRFIGLPLLLILVSSLVVILNSTTVHAHEHTPFRDGPCRTEPGPPNDFGVVHVNTNYHNQATGARGIARGAGVRYDSQLPVTENQTRSGTTDANGSICWGGLNCDYVRPETDGFEGTFTVVATSPPTNVPDIGSWNSFGPATLANDVVNRVTLTYSFTPRVNVEGMRRSHTSNDFGGYSVPVTQYSGQTVRVRNTSQGYNQTDNSGTSFSFSQVPAGSIWVAGSASGTGFRMRSSGAVGGYSNSFGGWGSEYTSVTREVLEHGDTMFVIIEYAPPPPPNQGNASATCDVISGSINLDYKGTARVEYRAWIEGESTPGWQSGPSFGSDYNSSRSYTISVPDQDKDAWRNTNVEVRHVYDPRSNEADHVAMDASIGPCGDYYDYQPSMGAISGNDPTQPKPGQTVQITPTVINQGQNRSGNNLAGDNFEYRLRITQGAENLNGYTGDAVDVGQWSRSGLTVGSSDNMVGTTRQFEADPDAEDGALVCFEFEIEPVRGQTWPTRYMYDDVINPNFSQVRESNESCLTIYNEQFELSGIDISGDTDFVTPGLDGSTLNLDVTVENQGNVNNPPADINNAGARLSNTSGVVTTIEIYSKPAGGSYTLEDSRDYGGQVAGGGSRTFSYDHEISNPTGEDVVYCFIAYSNPTAGWSDGSTHQGAPFNDTPNPIETSNLDDCQDETRVTTQSFFQNHRNDIASGVSFAPETNPLTQGCQPMTDPSRGFISATTTGQFGSLSEYAAYGLGAISGTGQDDGSNYGTAVRGPQKDALYQSAPGDDSLMFANQAVSGQLGSDAYRCMANLGEILSDTGDRLPGSGNLTPIFNPGFGSSPGNTQVTLPGGGQLFQSGSTPSPDDPQRATIVSNGDITISSDIDLSDNMHALAIIAQGNINIESSVERIDAMLYAIPDESGNGGVIDTCSDHTNLGTNVCREQLVVNGIVVADRLDLKRTYGGVSGGREQEPAEVFRFDPTHFIIGPYFVFDDDAPRPDLQSQRTLDLPPRF